MRRTRIYYTGEIQINVALSLDKNAAQHVRDVLRMQSGDALVLFNGNGCDYLGTVVQCNKKSVLVMPHASEQRHTISPLQLHLVQGLCRGEKMDFVIQKATELGVNEITPIVSEYGNVKLNQERLAKKLIHWQKVAASACEQCGRTDMVLINPVVKLDAWLKNDFAGVGYILDPGATQSLAKIGDVEKITLLVGPAGGFSTAEIQYAVQQGFKQCLIGPRILRSETAGLATMAVLQHLYGDF